MTAKLKEIIAQAIYVDRDMIPPTPCIQIQGRTVATPGNFITINGLPKHYKSTIMQFFIASALTGIPYHGIQLEPVQDKNICIIDTEQGVYDFHKQQYRLKNLISETKTPENLKCYLFRRYDPQVILQAIESILTDDKPKYLFIDNLTELVINANDIEESKKVVQLLKKWTDTFDTTIINLLHLGRSNLNTLGHLGAFADRAAQSALKVSVDKNTEIVTLEPSLMRSDKWFSNIHIQYDEETRQWYQAEVVKKETTSKKFNIEELSGGEHYNRLDAIFKGNPLKYSELTELVRQYYGIGANIAKQKVIPYLLQYKYILQLDRGIYSLNYKHNERPTI